jgi:glycosyltransferase involved in cell wall biosynthesis
MSRPFVSVITPTYNRREFLPYLIHQFNYQTYPKHLMELIILDDSPESNEDIIPKDDPRIKYVYLPEKIFLGKKRNMLNSMVKGDIIVCMDDDDYYSKERVSHAVYKLTSQPAIKIAGSTNLHIFYPHIKKIYKFGPYGPYHGTNGTMAYKKSYLENHSYIEDKMKAEEGHFTNDFSEPMVQLDPYKTMICLAHDCNTVEKTAFIPSGLLTKHKINKFFKDNDTKMINRVNELVEKLSSVKNI